MEGARFVVTLFGHELEQGRGDMANQTPAPPMSSGRLVPDFRRIFSEHRTPAADWACKVDALAKLGIFAGIVVGQLALGFAIFCCSLLLLCGGC